VSRYGARPEAWEEWLALGVGEDLLPSVANPNAKISADSKLVGIGKTPSRYNAAGEVVGIAKWTSYAASDQEIERWKAHPDYALSVQTRGIIGAIDVDVGDPAKAKAIRDAITNFLGPCPVRYREGSGKFLIPFKRSFKMTKRVLPVEGGMIEVLGEGQQFIADGYHQSGTRYQWNGTALPQIKKLDEAKLDELCALLEMCFGTGEWKIAREKRDVAEFSGRAERSDEVCEWLSANWECYDEGNDGQLFIECPFAVSHTTDSGPTATAYYPAGTGGYQQGHFVCLHAHCQGRDDRDFLDATGYSASEFADLAVRADDRPSGLDGQAPAKRELPALAIPRDKNGRIDASADNIVKLCSRPDIIDKHLAFDAFKDELIWAPASQELGEEQWRPFTDVDYVRIRIQLERYGMKPMGQDLLRQSIAMVAVERHIDTAIEWLSRLEWDGLPRIASFCERGWGWMPSDYSRAVSRYLWTALAGRVLDPGCQADMAPILVGPQGAGKTSAIKAMVPDDEFYTTIPLDGHDDDTSRRLRGKLVGELEELRGLNSRHIEEIKAWITRTSEEWVPKWKEFATKFKRRLVFFGSTNDDEFLNDPTGERRWLPGRCGQLDIDWIKANRLQLWAEGAAMFLLNGVEWEEAQKLGLEEHHEFKVTDSWEPAVVRWLAEPQINGQSPAEVGHVTTGEALSGAVNVPVAQHDKTKEMRMAKLLRSLGWNRKRITAPDGSRPWVYAKE
jgi:predicted P-loop ATPase